MKKELKNKKNAFTLVEILIATGVFVLVIITLSQVYISIIRSERVANALLNAENSLRNSLEVIARSVRMGKNFTFENNNTKLCFDYYLDNRWTKICYLYLNNTIAQSTEGRAYENLIDPNEIQITRAGFYYKGDLEQKESQISVIIPLEAKVTVKNQDYYFRLQTSITPRVFVKGI